MERSSKNIFIVKFEIIDSIEMDDKEIIDEVALIGPLKDEDATRELLNCKIYST